MAEATLSEAGLRRREAMRAMLAGAVVRRRRRRHALRASACVLLLGGGLWLAWPEARRPQQQPVARSPVVPSIRVIHDDPSVLVRLSCGSSVSTVRFLDDAGLLAELRKEGRPAGLVRHAGRVDLLPRIDDDWQAAQ
jgi:hypothetical protein